ncbi:hypothetical protein EVAR_70531_1 [Eumeta japonica]|uniref:Uncharacterized protein n=1 Tax=Eumeta variegata TaxID=151549 RepID=A0A4C1TGK5_EUMVA|nr:hypothetical protein EVAR_70531_1 [Eumeta japonica]
MWRFVRGQGAGGGYSYFHSYALASRRDIAHTRHVINSFIFRVARSRCQPWSRIKSLRISIAVARSAHESDFGITVDSYPAPAHDSALSFTFDPDSGSASVLGSDLCLTIDSYLFRSRSRSRFRTQSRFLQSQF